MAAAPTADTIAAEDEGLDADGVDDEGLDADGVSTLPRTGQSVPGWPSPRASRSGSVPGCCAAGR